MNEKSTKSLSFNILTTAPPDTSQTPRLLHGRSCLFASGDAQSYEVRSLLHGG